MSASLTPTVAAAPSGTETAAGLLALMTALTGVNTDINEGSQVRTLAEAIGAVAEEQGVSNVALAMQALAYGAMSLFNVAQAVAQAATGVAIFATSLPLSGAFLAPLAIPIPSGTLVQSIGGIQFSTTANTVLASGTSSVAVGIVATAAGAAGNVASGAISGLPLTPVGYPIYVTNAAPTAGGSDAGTQSQAIALFTARAAALGRASPVAVPNAVIGVTASGTGEVVRFSSAYEPWIAAGSGPGSGTAGFTLYVDNGTGTASPSLVAAVTEYITGNAALGEDGYRPIGVPFQVSGTTPVYCSAVVSGALYPGLLSTGSVVSTITSGVQGYFNAIGIAPAAAYQPQVAAVAGDAAAGAFQSLAVSLYYSGSGTPVPEVSGGVGTRVVLASLTVDVATAS